MSLQTLTLQTLITIAVMLLLVSGMMDYQDAMSEQAHYCDMVRAGAWPDFKDIYEETCNAD